MHNSKKPRNVSIGKRRTREETSLRHVTMVTKFPDDNKPKLNKIDEV